MCGVTEVLQSVGHVDSPFPHVSEPRVTFRHGARFADNEVATPAALSVIVQGTESPNGKFSLLCQASCASQLTSSPHLEANWGSRLEPAMAHEPTVN